jgi:RNA polymerase sigma-70 factor (ECF subfamily)
MPPLPLRESTLELSRPVAIEPERRTTAAAVEEAVLVLFDDHRDPLLRYVVSFGLPTSDAEDLVQDVFLALFRHLGRGGSQSNVQGWLFRVAHNLALKRRTRRQRERDRTSIEPVGLERVADPGRDPEEQCADDQSRRRLTAVLHALPERDRRCVHLRGHGLRYREIADVLGISLGSVAKSLTRSIARLQRANEG